MPSFQELYKTQQALSTRPFKARGSTVNRCSSCQLSVTHCICQYKAGITTSCEFILLMHHDEIFKPTNTGRLIADTFPKQTQVFCWDRTQPDPTLITLLNNPKRQCYLLFPEDTEKANALAGNNNRTTFTRLSENNKTHTFILLDGTWRQSARMLRLSRWLDNVATLTIPSHLTSTLANQYLVRKAQAPHQLATAQAAQLCLKLAGEAKNADILKAYFDIFNLHYKAVRMNQSPIQGAAHHFLTNLTALRGTS